MKKNDKIFSIQEALNFTRSPEGKAVLSYLEKNYGSRAGQLEQAVQSGDTAALQDQMKKMAEDPELQKLLGRKNHE